MPTKPPSTDINFQNPKTGSKEKAKTGFPPGKKLLVAGMVLLLLFLFLLAAAAAQKRQAAIPVSLPEPQPTAAAIQPRAASVYASDSAILKTEEALLKIESDIQNTDFYETTLNPPVLDQKVSF